MKELMRDFLKLCLVIGNVVWPPAEGSERSRKAEGLEDIAMIKPLTRKRGRPRKGEQRGQ